MTPSPPCRADGLSTPLLIPADRTPRSPGAWTALNLLVLVVYSVLGAVIVLFGIGPAKISPVYPPSGIAFAATAILGPRVLPAVFLGQFFNGFPLLMLPGTTLPMYILANGGTGIGGILEALLAAWSLQRFAGTPYPFERPRQVVIFLLGSALAPAVVGGTLGTLSMWACGFVPRREVAETLATFIFSDASGIAVFGALVLAWHREPLANGKLVGVSLGAIAGIVLVGLISAWTRHPIFFLYLPLLLWAAFGGGPRGVTVAATAITAVALITTSYGVGSFVGRTPEESVLLLVIFISVMTFTGLVTVAVLAQRRQAELALEAYNRQLEQRVAERTAEVAEKNRLLEEKQARIDEDLHTARVLQTSILPTDFSAYRDTDIAAAMRPALEMSGDFYDVFPLDGGRLGLVVADVSGKGVASAFFMAVTRTMLRNAAQGGVAPADCIARVNEALCRENPVDMFVTALYGELEQGSGKLRIVNAGHCEPIIVRAGGAVELLRRSGNPPLGVMDGRKFAEVNVTLGAGDMLFLYTDGVTEAADRNGEMFSVPRLLEAVRPLAGRPAKELMLSVIAGVESFSAGALQADDITCLAVRRNRV
jgi:serine phosphatase RsbU (regulator of sigma subunit)